MGQIFAPSGELPWMHSHAAVPIAQHIEGDFFRIYFSSRDITNRSFTGSLVLDITKPQEIVELSQRPILVPGALGEFDDSGAMGSWICHNNEREFFYYIGWNLGTTVPFRNSIGVATKQPSGEFTRLYPGPIVDRSVREPQFCASCCVIPESGLWRMWYLSCTGWSVIDGRYQHQYHIKYAESSDGLHWQRDGLVAIDYADASEYAISRPSVVHDDIWRMWYSHRGKAYRIGYAESEDGRVWKRMDSIVGINVSSWGWDSEMIEYPYVFDHKGSRYMLYNGNGYGKTGFGLAVLTTY